MHVFHGLLAHLQPQVRSQLLARFKLLLLALLSETTRESLDQLLPKLRSGKTNSLLNKCYMFLFIMHDFYMYSSTKSFKPHQSSMWWCTAVAGACLKLWLCVLQLFLQAAQLALEVTVVLAQRLVLRFQVVVQNRQLLVLHRCGREQNAADVTSNMQP